MSMFGNDPVETGIEEAAAYLAAASKGPQPAPVALSGTSADGADHHVSGTLRAAESYIRAGWKTFPGKRGNKEPVTGWSWKKRHLTPTDLSTYFDKDQHNVLVVLGNDSGNLTDIDLDWPEAAAVADLIFNDLPSFGRSGKPRSHRLAICDKVKTRKYQLPQSLADHSKVVEHPEHMMCVAEVRGGGSYTVFPGSEHATGEKVEWTDLEAGARSIPAIEPNILLKKMGLLAFVAFCMRFFPAVGSRCDFMMAVAGALARAGCGAELIQQTVQCIGAFNNDEGDNGSWRVSADSVTNKLDEGKEITGLPRLIKILSFGDDVLAWCREMLGAVEEAADSTWPDGHYKNGKPKKGILNTIEAFKRAGITCTWDDFTQKECWSGHDDKAFDGDVSDASVTVTRRNLHKKFGIFPSAQGTRDAITRACRDNKSDPVLSYFADSNGTTSRGLRRCCIAIWAPRTRCLTRHSASSSCVRSFAGPNSRAVNLISNW